jgi:response regulator RpfG family c-di-GMP phosphodiesterase
MVFRQFRRELKIEEFEMQKLLFYSTSNEGLGFYLDSIERKLAVQSTVVKNENAVKLRLEEKVFHLFILDVNTVNEATVSLVHDIRDRGFNVPVLIVANSATQDQFVDLLNMSQVHVLLRPFHEKGIIGIVRKLLISKAVPKQAFRRFNTNQIAQIERLTSGNEMLSNMYNLSRGGAYCEFDANEVLVVGDIIKMKVALNDLKAEHTFSAKVIWTTRKGKFSGRFGCGVRFVNSNDIHRLLLAKS